MMGKRVIERPVETKVRATRPMGADLKNCLKVFPTSSGKGQVPLLAHSRREGIHR
jgi:hypothetical protein